MAEKLFENIGGNRFKLLTESMNQNKAKLIREGLKKVFANAKEDLTYDKIGNFGLGFIKDVTEARKCALQEARDIAPGLGFADHPETGTFVKEVSWHDEESYKQSHGDPYDTEPWPDNEENIPSLDPIKEKKIRAEMRKLLSHTFQEPLLSKAIDDAIQAIKTNKIK